MLFEMIRIPGTSELALTISKNLCARPILSTRCIVVVVVQNVANTVVCTLDLDII